MNATVATMKAVALTRYLPIDDPQALRVTLSVNGMPRQDYSTSDMEYSVVECLAFISGQFELGFTLARWPDGPLDVDVFVTAVLASIVVSVVSSVLAFVRLVVPKV